MATPDALLVVDERDRTLTFAEYRDACERVAAGLAAEGVGEGTPVSCQFSTWIESFELVGALRRGSARSKPDPAICREREGLHDASDGRALPRRPR